MCNATLDGPVVNGRVCFNITYVKGHALPASAFILFRCTTNGTDMSEKTIIGISDCMEVDPHPSYTIIVTDADAEEDINVVAPVTITNVSVPSFTIVASSTYFTVSSTNNIGKRL